MGAFRSTPLGVGDVIKVGVVLRCVTELSQLATSHRFCSGSAGPPCRGRAGRKFEPARDRGCDRLGVPYPVHVGLPAASRALWRLISTIHCRRFVLNDAVNEDQWFPYS